MKRAVLLVDCELIRRLLGLANNIEIISALGVKRGEIYLALEGPDLPGDAQSFIVVGESTIDAKGVVRTTLREPDKAYLDAMLAPLEDLVREYNAR